MALPGPAALGLAGRFGGSWTLSAGFGTEREGCASQVALFSPDPNRPREATIPRTPSPGSRREEGPRVPETGVGRRGPTKAGGSADPSEGARGPGAPSRPARARGPEPSNLLWL